MNQEQREQYDADLAKRCKQLIDSPNPNDPDLGDAIGETRLSDWTKETIMQALSAVPRLVNKIRRLSRKPTKKSLTHVERIRRYMNWHGLANLDDLCWLGEEQQPEQLSLEDAVTLWDSIVEEDGEAAEIVK